MKLVMRKKFLNEKGFTLIEIIASLVILVIVGALVIISTVKIVQGFVFTKMNAETSQKGHIALNRLTKEFTNIISVDPAKTNATSIEFDTFLHNGTLVTHSVSWAGSGQPLYLNYITPLPITNNILVDNVSNFALTYYDEYKVIEITLSLVGANGNVSVFTTRVAPRNL